MQRRWGLLLVVCIVISLAGCSGTLSEGAEDTPAPTATQTDIRTSTDVQPETAIPTATPIPVDPDNPYGSKTLSVRVIDNSSTEYNRTSELNETFEYWSNNSERYAGYPVTFELTEDAGDPDIEVEFVDEIPECGLVAEQEHNLGCASLPGDSVNGPVTVEIENEYNSESTSKILKHEFGHALGIVHGEPPTELMQNTTTVAAVSSELTVAVDEDSSYHPGAINRQVSGAIEFFESGGDGTVASDVTITEVDDPSDADIYMEITGNRDVCGGDVFCVESDLECYMDDQCSIDSKPVTTITAGAVKTDVVGWILGFEIANHLWLDYALVEWPDELDAEKTDPAKSWWMN